MPLFNWSEIYSVKISEIDNQHKKLVDLINKLHEDIHDGKGKEKIESVVTDLVNYAKYHFAYEENLFSDHHYPDAQLHSKMHDNFIKQVQNYVMKLESGDRISPLEILDFLMKWLVEHIIGTDKQYTSFLNARGIN